MPHLSIRPRAFEVPLRSKPDPSELLGSGRMSASCAGSRSAVNQVPRPGGDRGVAHRAAGHRGRRRRRGPAGSASGGTVCSRGPSAGPPAVIDRPETDVLKLLATGCSNRQIARELVIGEKTVKTHVSRILAKLGVQSDAGGFARGSLGLVPAPAAARGTVGG